MATEKPAKKKRQLRKQTQTVRQKSASKAAPVKTRKLHHAKNAAKRPIVAARNIGKREYHIIKPKDEGSKLHKFLTKSRKATPGYFRNAWAEVKQVSWPTRSETWRLTFAVFIFSIGLGLLIAGIDWGLQKLFREVIIG